MMKLSEKRAKGLFRPWWDEFFWYSEIACLAVGVILISTTTNEPIRGLATRRRRVSGNDTEDDDSQAEKNNTNFGMAHLQKVLVDGLAHFTEDIVSQGKSVTTPAWNFLAMTTASTTGIALLLMLQRFFEMRFYNCHLVHTLCHVVETLADVRLFRYERNTFVFSGAIHHCFNKTYLRTMFQVNNAVRMILLLACLAFSCAAVNEIAHIPRELAHDILVIVLVSLIAVQMPVMFFASFWPSLSRNATWGKLMVYYHRAVEKMDVARGRTVPLPPFTGHKDKERVLESLNPYDANASLALLMDFLAMKHGVGLTLKTLCFLEADVYDNWRPHQLGVAEEADGGWTVTWTDPPAIAFVSAMARRLAIHFGIEITIKNPGTGQDRRMLSRIVGYDESRYRSQMWHASRPNVVDLSDSRAFHYAESFSTLLAVDDHVLDGSCTISVDVWTIVDGHLLAKSVWSHVDRASRTVPNAVTKPPRVSCGSTIRDDGTSPAASGLCPQEDIVDETQSRSRRASAPKELVITPPASCSGSTASSTEPSRRIILPVKNRAASLSSLTCVQTMLSSQANIVSSRHKSLSLGYEPKAIFLVKDEKSSESDSQDQIVI